ncbi:chorismate mutase [Rhodococcus ruber Chol-4]|uniref:Chorismate mutase n=1 Tax=Rhodococcus ruber TaxID=1830 RepID=A0A098BFD6_9NOCA|nr:MULTISPECIES: chorismate mutase [Rhodococcus]MDO2381753.1 chorismate mutase [Rhodococcus ruber]RIK09506.1 MAG: chorismate mutase [Acidobacteriota bacterium]ATQ27915.1 chorismate mutase [Rhodococcus ruber]AUM15109.1 chorismate mutase [Rhodococcus ruber]AWG99299.1 chorismate mutase [Rhodococcus ruber]
MDNSNDHRADATAESAPDDLLDGLRTELDRVDARLLDTVRDRLRICARIAHLKQRHAIPMLQPGRMQVVHARAESYAHRNDMSPEFLHSLYALLIAEACRVEDLIIDGPGAAPAQLRETRT